MKYMDAALLKTPGELKIEKIPAPPCPSSGILVEVKACGICSSDVKMAKIGHPALIYPRILGHEISGRVVESKTPHFSEGDRVQIAPGLNCQRCSFCKKGIDNLCDHIGIFGFTHNGGFAKYLAVPLEGEISASANIISEPVSFEEATLTEPLACCLNAQERLGITSEDVVLILGAGPMGCLNAMLARIKGARKVFLVEPLERRELLAKFTKADLILNPNRENIYHLLKQETLGFGIDVVILASSEIKIEEDLLKLLTPRARICLFSGLLSENARSPFSLNLIHYKEICLLGAYGCTKLQNKEALSLISSGKIDLNWLITERIPLKRIKEGIDYVAERRGMKAVITSF